MKPGVLLLDPYLKEVVWGTDRLQRDWRKAASPDVKLGESWEISCVPGGESGVRGLNANLRELYERDPAHFRGDEAPAGAFPLLVKLLATSDVLSVQVHPDDAQARELDGQRYGKHEAWLVLDCDPDARLYLGLAEGATKAQLGEALRDGRSEDVAGLLREVPVAPGMVFDITPGTIHAIGAGLVIAEIQQPSDITYRVFDWGRVGLDGQPRELHVDKAMAVTREDARPHPAPVVAPLAGMDGEILLRTGDFRIERWRVDGTLEVPVTELLTCVCVGGEGTVRSPQSAPQAMAKGDSCVIPRGVSMAGFEGRGLELVMALPPA